MNYFKNHDFKWNWKRVVGLALILVTFLTGCVWAGGSLKSIDTDVSITTARLIRESSAPPAMFQGFVQGKRPTSVLEAHLITISPDGIEPAEINTSQGHFILVYENRSGLDNISLRFTSSETSIHQLAMPLLKTLWTGEFNLAKGIYELKESSHADWVCTITIH